MTTTTTKLLQEAAEEAGAIDPDAMVHLLEHCCVSPTALAAAKVVRIGTQQYTPAGAMAMMRKLLPHLFDDLGRAFTKKHFAAMPSLRFRATSEASKAILQKLDEGYTVEQVAKLLNVNLKFVESFWNLIK
jgi:DNA-binding NarL/FixJ family response regulator